MLDLNPMHHKNPYFRYVKQSGKWETAERIRVDEIESALNEVLGIGESLKNGMARTRVPKDLKEKTLAEVDYFDNWVAGIRKDLFDTSKFIKCDGYYVRAEALDKFRAFDSVIGSIT